MSTSAIAENAVVTPNHPFIKGVKTFDCPKGHGQQEVYVVSEYTKPICPVCAKEDEKEAARLRGIEICQRNTHIPSRYLHATFDNFKTPTQSLQNALRICCDYSGAAWQENFKLGRCLLLIGPPGVGKTHLACALTHAVASQGASAEYVAGGDYLREMRDTWRRDSRATESSVLSEYVKPRLLVLDDVGTGCNSESEHRLWFDLIDQRYSKGLPTVVISNCDIPGLKLAIGDRGHDRLRENGGKLIIIKGESWRGKHDQCAEGAR